MPSIRKWEEVSIRRAAIEKGKLNANEHFFPICRYSAIPGEECLIALDHIKPIWNQLISSYANCRPVTGFGGAADKTTFESAIDLFENTPRLADPSLYGMSFISME
jgi:hypothetical protein